MFKGQKYKFLSFLMSMLLLFSNFIGIGGQNVVRAETTTIVSEGFDSILNSPGTTAAAVAPAGWTFTGIGAYGSTSTGYFTTAPSAKFGANNAQIVTPTFNLNSQATLSFWVRGASTNADSHLLVEKSGGTSWNTVEDIKPLPSAGTVKTYALEQDIKQIRFTYAKAAGNVALDDILITEDSTTPPATTVNVDSVTLDKSSIGLNVSATTTLIPTISPSNATNKNVTWSSDNQSVATVDEHTGLITGVSEGTANITVTTEDGNKTAVCVVNVTQSASKIFDIVEITDFHGQLLDSTNTYYVGAALSKAVKDIKAANPQRTLIISGGDNYQGTPLSNVLYGAPVRDVFNDMGVQVTALGNHEFDWGLNKIINTTMQGANYQILCANLYKKGTNERVFQPYKVITEDGVRIAVIGAITNETPTIVLPANVADYTFTDAATEINSVAKSIKDNKEADVVIADIHEGSTALNDIISNLHGVDAVFGGHSHTSLDTVLKDADGKDVPTFNAMSSGKGYVDLKMTVNTSDNSLSFSAKGKNYKSLTVTSSTPLDSNAKAIIDEANGDIAPIFNEVIGRTAASLTKDQGAQPYGESQLGNWMSDVVKNYAQADVGMVNNGGIRLSPIPAGDITVGTIFYLMPFDNTVCTVSMTGAQLKILLEQAVQDNGKGIQISGIKFTYDSSKASYKPAVVDAAGQVTTPAVPGERITKIVRESDGTEIKDTDVLKVAAPDFMATGGDTFTEFIDEPTVKSSLIDSHYTVRDALIADVRAAKTIPNEMAGRIANASTGGSSGTATEMTIAEARTAASGNAILTGTVTTVSGKNVFIQDSTAGICFYNSSGAVVKKGDNIKVTGLLSVYNGLLEITPASSSNVQVISSGNTVLPQVVTINGITDSLQGQLIQVNDATLNNIDTAGSSVIQDDTGSVVIFKIPTLNGITEGDKVNVTAAVSKYGSTIELYVGDAADVVKTGSSPVTTPSATIAIIATSDIHGNVYNYDYASGAAPSKGQGLAKVSTYVKGVRAANPNVMLIDDGDTIQGTPLSYYYDMIDKTSEYPMMKVMGAMGYDTWTLGNHEFNYGMDTLNRIIADAKNEHINVLSANTYKEDGTNFVDSYYIKPFTVNGRTIKIGILGLTTKCIPNWEDPAHYAGLHFNDLVDEAKKWVPIVRQAGADVVIVAAHSGEESATDVIPENEIKAIATQVSGIDAIVAGHVHNVVNDLTLKNPDGKVVPVVEPGKWGNDVSQIDISVDESGNITGLKTKNVVMDSNYPEDTDITTLAQPYQNQTLQYIQTVLGTSGGEFKGEGQYVVPTAIMDLVNKVQMNAAGTQLSIAAPLSASAYIPQGNVTIKDIMSVYVYENFLYGVKMTGKQLKNWMEYSVRYYKQINDPSLKIDSTTDYRTLKDTTLNIADYNLDQLYGATYDVDLTELACTLDADGKVVSGNRIKNLKFNGVPVKDDDVFTVAINNYRYNGGGGFMNAVGLSNTDPSLLTYDSAKALGDDGQVRSLMMSYLQNNGKIDPACLNNWKLSAVPVTSDVTTTTPEAPSVTADDENNIIVGADNSMEYSTDNGTTWTTYDSSNVPTFSGDVTVQVRVKAVSGVSNESAVTTLNFTTAQVIKYDFSIKNVSTQTTLKAGNDADIRIEATNETNSDENGTLVIGLFQGDKFVRFINYVKLSEDVEAGKSVILDGGFMIPAGSNYSIKCMVLKGLDDITPLSDDIELPVAN